MSIVASIILTRSCSSQPSCRDPEPPEAPGFHAGSVAKTSLKRAVLLKQEAADEKQSTPELTNEWDCDWGKEDVPAASFILTQQLLCGILSKIDKTQLSTQIKKMVV